MFDQNGRFIPNQAANPGMGPATQAAAQPQQVAMKGFGIQPTPPQGQFGMANQRMSPGPMVANNGYQMAQAPAQRSMSQLGGMVGGPMQANNGNSISFSGQMPPQPAPAGGFGGGPHFGNFNPQNYQGQMPQYQQNYQQNYQQQMPVQPSVEQSVHNNSPQSVQNFLMALNKVGAGTNNTFMNGQGQQGQGPQAGFQGFQQNGQHYQNNQQSYSGPMASGLGWQGNMSGMNGDSYYQNQASQGNSTGNYPGYQGGPIQQGGTGGVAGQPGFQQQQNPNSQEYQYWHNLNNSVSGGESPDTYTAMMAGRYNGGPSQDQSTGYPGQAVSDQTAKTEIASGEHELQSFLDSLGVYSYEYKDKQYGEGRRISPMAQEIESTNLGKDFISTNKEGYKQVDYGKMMGTQLAALAMINHKQKMLEDTLQQVLAKKKAK